MRDQKVTLRVKISSKTFFADSGANLLQIFENDTKKNDVVTDLHTYFVINKI
jgi:hypothetical protein